MSLANPYNLLVDNLMERYVTKDKKSISLLEDTAFDMVLLLINLLINDEIKLTSGMREAMQKQICRSTQTDFDVLKRLLQEESERLFEDRADQQVNHMND